MALALALALAFDFFAGTSKRLTSAKLTTSSSFSASFCDAVRSMKPGGAANVTRNRSGPSAAATTPVKTTTTGFGDAAFAAAFASASFCWNISRIDTVAAADDAAASTASAAFASTCCCMVSDDKDEDEDEDEAEDDEEENEEEDDGSSLSPSSSLASCATLAVRSSR